jgi:N-acetylmuramoyl-L-alanine amidase
VCHHSAGPANQSIQAIHDWHRHTLKWAGVGYNLLQTPDGRWHEGRGLDAVGSHAVSYNQSTVGLCLIGNFEDHPVPPARYDSLVEMCAFLLLRYDLAPVDIRGHKELPGARTLCPGKHLDLSGLRRDVAARLHTPLGEPSAPDLPPVSGLWRAALDGVQQHALADPIPWVQDAVRRNEPRTISLQRVPR